MVIGHLFDSALLVDSQIVSSRRRTRHDVALDAALPAGENAGTVRGQLGL